MKSLGPATYPAFLQEISWIWRWYLRTGVNVWVQPTTDIRLLWNPLHFKCICWPCPRCSFISPNDSDFVSNGKMQDFGISGCKYCVDNVVPPFQACGKRLIQTLISIMLSSQTKKPISSREPLMREIHQPLYSSCSICNERFHWPLYSNFCTL